MPLCYISALLCKWIRRRRRNTSRCNVAGDSLSLCRHFNDWNTMWVRYRGLKEIWPAMRAERSSTVTVMNHIRNSIRVRLLVSPHRRNPILQLKITIFGDNIIGSIQIPSHSSTSGRFWYETRYHCTIMINLILDNSSTTYVLPSTVDCGCYLVLLEVWDRWRHVSFLLSTWSLSPYHRSRYPSEFL